MNIMKLGAVKAILYLREHMNFYLHFPRLSFVV